jgi:sulfatase modifying factor 1
VSNARSQQAGLTPAYYTDVGLTQVFTNGYVTPYVNWVANGYRLPTEAEWEKAARGELSGQRFPWGDTISESQANYLGDTAGSDVFGQPGYSYDLGPNGYNAIGNYPATSSGTSPVGYFAANGYGLYDMAGNVFEWCWDWDGTPYGQPTTTNPTGPATGIYRILRGGSWARFADDARCASRGFDIPGVDVNSFGFRCVRGL